MSRFSFTSDKFPNATISPATVRVLPANCIVWTALELYQLKLDSALENQIAFVSIPKPEGALVPTTPGYNWNLVPTPPLTVSVGGPDDPLGMVMILDVPLVKFKAPPPTYTVFANAAPPATLKAPPLVADTASVVFEIPIPPALVNAPNKLVVEDVVSNIEILLKILVILVAIFSLLVLANKKNIYLYFLYFIHLSEFF